MAKKCALCAPGFLLRGFLHRKSGYLPGFGRCGIQRLSTRVSIPATNLKAWAICSLQSSGSAFVESHICQNRADMGHPGVPLRVKRLRPKAIGVPATRPLDRHRLSKISVALKRFHKYYGVA
jgi:hypothetical protein